MLDTVRKTRSLNIGDRIECVGYFGTIKYIGLVEGYPSTWLGIDWDDYERGKHDGCVKGKRYFVASCPKSGSFVRPEKVHLGQSAITSITSRYGRKDDEISEKIKQQQLLRFQQSINAPFLELVGFDKVTNKQSNFNNLQVVNLRLQNVYTCGEPGELADLCPNITELDISKNLMNSWTDVFDICSQLKELVWLNISENYLTFPDDLANVHFPNLRTLVCGSMKLSWDDILKLSALFPNMEELRAPSNRIKNLDTPVENNFKSLKLLDLENNPVAKWSEVLKLAVIPTIEQLNLENISLKEIAFPESQKTESLANLKKLVVTNNLINDWQSIGELNKLQTFEELRFFKNPILTQENSNTSLQLIIARIANLKNFNGTKIEPGERRGAEYDYIKKYGLEYLLVKNTDRENEFLKNHNRYDELIEKHGIPEESELQVPSKVINVSLIDLEISHDDRTIKKKLPPSILIQKLTMLVQRLFNLPDRPNLVYVSGVQPDIEIALDEECKELGYYSVQNGDKIIVKH